MSAQRPKRIVFRAPVCVVAAHLQDSRVAPDEELREQRPERNEQQNQQRKFEEEGAAGRRSRIIVKEDLQLRADTARLQRDGDDKAKGARP